MLLDFKLSVRLCRPNLEAMDSQHSGQESAILSDGAFSDVIGELGHQTLNDILKEEPFGVPEEPSQGFLPFMSMQHVILDAYSSQQERAGGELTFLEPAHVMARRPSSTSVSPCTDIYVGPNNFTLWVDTQHFSNNCMFSEALKKVYITKQTKLPLKFKWDQCAANLYLRALPCFEVKDFFEEPVQRCIGHEHPNDESNAGFEHVSHVIRCDNRDVRYVQDSVSGRLSLLVPLDAPQAGTEWVTVTFSFVCKNSCISGMNRRATFVVFTLETEWGEVVGREKLWFRVCSCPKRDMKKEEADYQTRLMNNEESDAQGGNLDLFTKSGKRQKNPNHSKLLSNKKCKISPSDMELKIFPSFMYVCASVLAKEITGNAHLNNREITPIEKTQVKECKRYIELHSLVEIVARQPALWSECSLVLVETMPSGLYVNPDQLADLKRLNQTLACPNITVDVETPQPQSIPHTVYVYSMLHKSQNLLSARLVLPFHARYHSPSPYGGYAHAILGMPSLLLRCDTLATCLEGWGKVEVPCEPCSPQNCYWYNLTFKTNSPTVTLKVPVGNLSHSALVTACTLAVTCGACVYILISLDRARQQGKMKE